MTDIELSNDIKFELPEDVCSIIKTLEDAGFEAYAVGGCVRDMLLGKIPDDWDITTSARPLEVKALFKRTVDTGLQHGTVTVLMKNKGKLSGYEVTTYRIDGDYSDGRHPDKVEFSSELSEDLKRRDFTINAMAYHPERGLTDLFDGKADLEKKLIRCVGDAKERFSEDALRMMRAVRFAAVLGGTIEAKTYEAIKALAGNLKNVSGERIRVETEKLLVSSHPYYFKQFYETGLTAYFLPEFDICMNTAQENIHHCYTVGEHLLHSLETIDTVKLKKESGEDTYRRDLKILRLTMLLHDIAKPAKKTVDESGVAHFKGHPALGADMAEEILTRLKYDNDTIRMVKGLVAAHENRYEPAADVLRRAINRVGAEFFPLLFYVNEADTLAQSMYLRDEKLKRIAALRRLYINIMEEGDCTDLKTLAVKGRDLIERGISPGPEIGRILGEMLEDVLEEPAHNEKEYLLEKYI